MPFKRPHRPQRGGVSAGRCSRGDHPDRVANRFRSLGLGAVASVLSLTAAPAAAEKPDSPAPTCGSPQTVELQRSVRFSESSERGYARQSAIRLAVVDALQQATGADISRSTQTATTSSSTAIERKTREHLVVRSGGRVIGWEVTGEETSTDADGDGRLLRVALRVEVCASPDKAVQLVVAIADARPSASGVSREVRARLAEAYAGQNYLRVTRNKPQDAFHDVRIEFDHTIVIEEVDNSDKADTLKKFGGLDLLDEAALHFQLVTVTTTARAVRFVDETTISDTVERRRRVSIDAPTAGAVRHLLVEASVMAGHQIGAKLGAGELVYFDER